MISEGVDGSPLYYTVTYSNAIFYQNVTICGSNNISSSSCLRGVCSSSLPLYCYQISGAINISVFASNILGNGLTSSISIGIIYVTHQWRSQDFGQGVLRLVVMWYLPAA